MPPFDPSATHSFFLDQGVPALLRPLTPLDRDRVIQAYVRLSPESAYLRFWTRFRELNPRFIERLLTPDPGDHATWIIVLPENDDIPGAGGGSFWRLKNDPCSAEVSFTVADEFQGQGVGTILLAALWSHARLLGITRFVAHVIDANFVMRTWWDGLGASACEEPRGWVLTLSLAEDDLPDTSPARRLRHWLAVLQDQNGRPTEDRTHLPHP